MSINTRAYAGPLSFKVAICHPNDSGGRDCSLKAHQQVVRLIRQAQPNKHRGSKGFNPTNHSKQPRWQPRQGQQVPLSTRPAESHLGESPEKEQSLWSPNGLHPSHDPRNTIHRRNIYPWLPGTEPGRSANGFQELCLAVPVCEAKEKNVGTGVEAVCLLSTLPR